jgi:hypothetical protein
MKLCSNSEQVPQKYLASKSEVQNVLLDYIRYPASKRLINTIHRAHLEKGVKSIAVLGEQANAGKTLFVSAIALGFMTLLNKRVLIMDTVSQTRDESFYFHGVLQKHNTDGSYKKSDHPCVDLITSRQLQSDVAAEPPPPPATQKGKKAEVPMLSEGGFDTVDFEVHPFVESMKPHYDLILLDTCPLTLTGKNTIDPLIIAQYTDSAIVVVGKDSLQREHLQDLSRNLARHRIEPLGIVVDSGTI